MDGQPATRYYWSPSAVAVLEANVSFGSHTTLVGESLIRRVAGGAKKSGPETPAHAANNDDQRRAYQNANGGQQREQAPGCKLWTSQGAGENAGEVAAEIRPPGLRRRKDAAVRRPAWLDSAGSIDEDESTVLEERTARGIEEVVEGERILACEGESREKSACALGDGFLGGCGKADGMGWHGMAWDGMGDELGWDGARWNMPLARVLGPEESNAKCNLLHYH